ncbi:MAG: transcriptional repressor [Marinilabiliaceae bacterium]|jgi:Fe2+ or Zn2+ uptake regulation protein|nr:transcriptional repressor [Bacteroidales bacterium]MCR5695861.1 transcriptional repressor [Marinilabiliaceae bacterium]
MNVADILIKHDVKPSVQRVAIMQYMLTHATHPTIEEVYRDLVVNMPTLSKTTVYNTLKLFEEQGIVQSLTIDESEIRYDGDISDHIHFKCEKCGKVYDLRFDDVQGSEAVLKTEIEGFRINRVNVFYRGICKYCNC